MNATHAGKSRQTCIFQLGCGDVHQHGLHAYYLDANGLRHRRCGFLPASASCRNTLDLVGIHTLALCISTCRGRNSRLVDRNVSMIQRGGHADALYLHLYIAHTRTHARAHTHVAGRRDLGERVWMGRAKARLRNACWRSLANAIYYFSASGNGF